MTSPDLVATQVFLNPEIVGFFPDHTKADLAAGKLFLDEHDFLLAAALPSPHDRESGIREGESLVVARLSPEGVFAPARRIKEARLTMNHSLLRDAGDAPDGPCVPLWLSGMRPNIFSNAEGRMLQVEDYLYVPSRAYGVWLLGSAALHPLRSEYADLMPNNPEFTIHIESRPALNQSSASEVG